MDKSYEDLPDEDYWKIRNILIEEHPAFNDVALAPPYEYTHKEEKIMTAIQHMLHRHLIQDVSVIGKIFILIIWIAAITSPWLMKMDMYFFRRLIATPSLSYLPSLGRNMYSKCCREEPMTTRS